MMGLSQFFGKETVVGIDIGSRYLKALQVMSSGAGRWRVVKAGIAPTPSDAVRDGIIINRSAVAAALKELIRSTGIEATGACTAISGGSVIVRHIKLPRVPENVLRKSIRYEAGKYISSSVDDSQIECEITGPVPGEDDKMGVMLVAAPNEMVESRLGTLIEAGLEPIAIDLEMFALQRSLLDLSATRPGDGITIALLDIGAVKTEVSIIADSRFALTRNIPVGGDGFTNTLKSVASRSDWESLEDLKAKVDMATLLDPDSDPEAAALARTVQPAIDELLREVRRSMNYYQSQLTDAASSNLPAGVTSQTGGGTVSKIVITGGSARMQGLQDYMAVRLGVEVEAWNIFDNPAYDTSALAPSFVRDNHSLFGISMGLALKEMTDAALRATTSPVMSPVPRRKPAFSKAA